MKSSSGKDSQIESHDEDPTVLNPSDLQGSIVDQPASISEHLPREVDEKLRKLQFYNYNPRSESLKTCT